TPTSLILQPGHVVGGRTTTGIVTLPSPAPPGGAIVSLTADQPAAIVPARVKVPVGLTWATFPIGTSPVPRATPVLITAVDNDVSWQATLQVEPPTPQF